MRIVVLDGYALNPGDLDWSPLAALGELVVHDRTSADSILERSAEADILLTNKVPVDMHAIYRLQGRLKMIGLLSTGFNVVDVEAARECRIPVCNVPAYGAMSVAQHTFALLLELCHQVGRHSALVRNGEWAASRDWTFSRSALTELAGLRLGIVGYGSIGRQVARIAEAFGMEVVAHGPHPSSDARFVSLDELLRTSDVVSLHCPLNMDTQGMIDRESLAIMKPTAILLNTARGGLVVERDLARALEDGQIAAAALDVLTVEPPPSDSILTRTRNCIVTPHIAWATRAARQRLMDGVVANVAAFVAGRPANVVNGL